MQDDGPLGKFSRGERNPSDGVQPEYGSRLGGAILERSVKASAGEATYGGLAHSGAVDILPASHQGEQRAEDARLDFVRHRAPAGRHADKRGAAPLDFAHKFLPPLVRDFAQIRFAAHFCAFLLDKEREMQDTHALAGESRRDHSLATL